jgi:PAS domain S-box-containing protein
MSDLMAIQGTVQQIAEGITEALGIETEIIDRELTIIAGTGRYFSKIGQKEESGNLDSGYIYGQLLKSGSDYVIEQATPLPPYGAKENELAEICCSIQLEGQVLGLIALVAFNEEQKTALFKEGRNHMLFLKRMALLIAAKLSETKKTNHLKVILESIRDGLLAVDRNGVIVSCNRMAEQLIGKDRSRLLGRELKEVWPECPIHEILRSGSPFQDREEIYTDENGEQKHFLTNILPVFIGDEEADSTAGEFTEAVISFQGIDDVRTMIYQYTENKQKLYLDEILGISESIREIKSQAEQIARSQSTVLITGESGTGKEIFARAIHSASKRSKEAFVTVNCGAIPENLLESELFGYDEGAFTGARKRGKVGKFELANKGSIFLDEVGDLPLHLQVKLLHVLQRREIERVGGNRVIQVDVRVIAATNRDLQAMMEQKEFREDLFFRLNVIPLPIPPLRDRKEDIPILVHYFLDRFNGLIGKNITGFDTESMELMQAYQWPGNIRELENAVEYAVNLEKGNLVTVKSIPPRVRDEWTGRDELSSLKDQIAYYEKKIIEVCLKETGTSMEGKRRAAEILGISEATLYRRIRELHIDAWQRKSLKG